MFSFAMNEKMTMSMTFLYYNVTSLTMTCMPKVCKLIVLKLKKEYDFNESVFE